MADYRQMLQQQGFPNPALAYAVMMAESGGNPKAFNPNVNTGDQSYGLFQINMLGGLGPDRRARYGLKRNEDLYDPATNIRIAYQMSKGGKDWSPWSAYKSGAYKKYMDASMAAQGSQATPSPGTPPASNSPRFDMNSLASMSSSPRGSNVLGFIQAMRQREEAERSGRDPSLGGFLQGLQQLAPQPRQLVPEMQANATAPTPGGTPGSSGTQAQAGAYKAKVKGAVRELFYDPLGAYDEGNWINPIGGHSDHVHVSFGDPQAAIQIINQATQMGLRASENPYAEGSMPEKDVHTPSSYHYQYFPGTYEGGKLGQLGMGLDVSGDPNKMAAFYKWVRSRYT